MPISKKQIRPLARLHGFWLYHTFLARTHSWPVEKRRSYVLEKLRQTLIRAYEGIPFYRARFDEVGFGRRNISESRRIWSVCPRSPRRKCAPGGWN